MANKTKLVLGLLGAAAAGVVVGMLLAPDNGASTRKKIKGTATDWADHLSDLFTSAKGEIDNLTKKGTKAAEEAYKKYNKVKEETYS